MNPTKTRELGKTGVQLTQPGFGGAPLGELFVRVDEATAAATLNAASDVGIRYFDTAPYFGRGLSEIRFGRFLNTKPRSEFVLSTKVGRCARCAGRRSHRMSRRMRPSLAGDLRIVGEVGGVRFGQLFRVEPHELVDLPALKPCNDRVHALVASSER